MSLFFNDTATTEIYTLSLHDALPISSYLLLGGAAAQHEGVRPDEVAGIPAGLLARGPDAGELLPRRLQRRERQADRKSTRLNSSHANISYAVFCLKKKKLSLFIPHSF